MLALGVAPATDLATGLHPEFEWVQQRASGRRAIASARSSAG
jgi:hypothetical protein